MEKPTLVKTFLEALVVIPSDRRKVYSYLKDKRLSYPEKEILKCWVLLREAKFLEIIDTLNNKPNTTHEIVESQRLLLLGITFNNKSDFKNALNCLIESEKILSKYPELSKHLFTLYYNMFIIYLNQKNKTGMEHTYENLKGLDLGDDISKIVEQRCLFNIFKTNENYTRAEELLKLIVKSRKKMNVNLIISSLIDEFDYYVKTEQFDRASAVLEEMKNIRSFNYGANFKFMKYLLKHVMDNSPVYVYEKDFADYPTLLNQIMVIKNLEAKNEDEAKIYWNKLSLDQSDIYRENFNYKGDKSLFSIALNKHMKNECEKNKGYSFHLKRKDLGVVDILEKFPAGVSQEELYFKLWKQDAITKDDYNKLSKLVSRVKKDFNLTIKFKKGCYFLIKNQESKAS